MDGLGWVQHHSIDNFLPLFIFKSSYSITKMPLVNESHDSLPCKPPPTTSAIPANSIRHRHRTNRASPSQRKTPNHLRTATRALQNPTPVHPRAPRSPPHATPPTRTRPQSLGPATNRRHRRIALRSPRTARALIRRNPQPRRVAPDPPQGVHVQPPSLDEARESGASRGEREECVVDWQFAAGGASARAGG